MKSHWFRTAALAAAMTALLLMPAAGDAHDRAFTARASRVTASASGTTVTVKGRVQLRRDSAAVRRRVRVLITLADTLGHRERQSARLGANRNFRASWRTTLSGPLKVEVRLIVAGRTYGKLITRTVHVSQPASGSPGSPGSGTPLVGTFKLQAGSAPSGQAPTGSYFEMLQSNGSPLENLSSPAPNKDYTPLSPGTDGGLSTSTYQPAPSGALGTRVIQPVPFYVIDFSVETSPTDAQVGLPDPVPTIDANGDQLSGQITAWVAQWNGQFFNQGTPKPDGSVPSPTTRLAGSYDPATRAFTLDWKSLIVGGPFNGFTGVWHLSGTFVPAASTNGLLP